MSKSTWQGWQAENQWMMPAGTQGVWLVHWRLVNLSSRLTVDRWNSVLSNLKHRGFWLSEKDCRGCEDTGKRWDSSEADGMLADGGAGKEKSQCWLVKWETSRGLTDGKTLGITSRNWKTTGIQPGLGTGRNLPAQEETRVRRTPAGMRHLWTH